ncbi:ABC transporter permease subunit [Paenibacillus alvei]|nr:ABC transporter permease subunit [Paenibacillus alvei]NEZ41471.1 ABC transporter permease subunit [Paenibacillus alvei]
MNLVLHMLKSLCLSIFALLVVVFIVLFPRKLDIGLQGYKMTASYHFSWSQYADNITGFLHGVFVDHTLGVTRYEEPIGAVVQTAIGKSLTIIVIGFLLSSILGVMKGLADYKLSKSKWNAIGNGTTRLFQSVPDFMVVLLIQWFVIRYMPFIHFFEQKEWYAFLIPSVLVSIYPAMYIVQQQANHISHELFVEAGESLGLSRWRMVRNYYMPSLVPEIIINFCIDIGKVMLLIGQLGVLSIFLTHNWVEVNYFTMKFLNTSMNWVSLLAETRRDIYVSKFTFVFYPALAILLTVLTFNLLGEGLRRHFNRRMGSYL